MSAPPKATEASSGDGNGILNVSDFIVTQELKDAVPCMEKYERLIETERRMDDYVRRKRIAMRSEAVRFNKTPALNSVRDPRNTQFLRLFVSNVCEKQPWQLLSRDQLLEIANGTAPQQDFASACWTLRIEGRVLDDEPVEAPERAKFSRFLKQIKVELEKEGANETVEWNYDPKNPVDFDGFDIKRAGSENVNCKITIRTRDVQGQGYYYSESLTSLIGTNKGTLNEAVHAVYAYARENSLLHDNHSILKEDSTITLPKTTIPEIKHLIKLDSPLQELYKNSNLAHQSPETPAVITIADLPNIVNSHLADMPAIQFEYTVRTDCASTYGETIYDLEVACRAAPNLVADFVSLLTDVDKLAAQVEAHDKTKEIQRHALHKKLHESHKRYKFFQGIAKNPVKSLNKYIAASANALKVLSGAEGYNEARVRTSEFYHDMEKVMLEDIGVLLAHDRI